MSTTKVERPISPTVGLLRPVASLMFLGIGIQIVASFLQAVALVALSVLASRLITQPLPSALFGSSLEAPLVWFLTALGLSALGNALALLVTHFADVKLQADLRVRLARKLARLPLGWFDHNSSGRVRQLVHNDVDSLHQLVAHTVIELVTGVLTPMVSLAICFVVDWRLGLVALLPLLAYALTFSILARGTNRDVMDAVHQGLDGVSDAIVEYVQGIAVFKVFSRSSAGTKRFFTRSEHFLSDFERLVGPQMRAQSIAVIFLSAAVVGLVEVACGWWFIRAGWSTPADVLVVTVIAMMVPASLQTLAMSNQARTQAVDAAERVVSILDAEELPLPTHPETPAGHDVTLNNVSFTYDGDNLAVRDVSAHLKPGTVTALVGPSGSGKSTVASLIARHRDVTTGSIDIGGADIRSIDPEDLRCLVGTVFQDAQLLSMSIADNMRLGAPQASQAEIENAAKTANIHERILALPRGYDSVAGQDALLSGGEQQRISIARTVLADTPIVLLDEATSATDPESETAVQEGLNRLVHGRTVVVIAHRLNTIAGADEILVMDRGGVVEQGRHSDLLALEGLYASMWADMEQESREEPESHADRKLTAAETKGENS